MENKVPSRRGGEGADIPQVVRIYESMTSLSRHGDDPRIDSQTLLP
jgi:hypothetical protein